MNGMIVGPDNEVIAWDYFNPCVRKLNEWGSPPESFVRVERFGNTVDLCLR